MEHKRILPFLIIILFIACIIISVILASAYRRVNFISDDTIDAAVSILEKSNITIDRSMIPQRVMTGTVYEFEYDEYSSTVAPLLGGSKIKQSYIVPGNEIIVLENGSTLTFGNDFSITYKLDPEKDYFSLNYNEHIPPTEIDKLTEAEATAKEFLQNGSSGFESDSSIIIDTRVVVYRSGDIYSASCTRTIDGMTVNGNNIICIIKDGKVVEATGNWNFLTSGIPHTITLVDISGVLFKAKNDLKNARPYGNITIVSIGRCYSLTIGGNGNVFLVPCWTIETNYSDIFIYSGIDGDLVAYHSSSLN